MSRCLILPLPLVAAVLLAFALPFTARAQSYQVVDLGQMQPTAINATGEVVGSIGGQAAMYSNGSTTILGVGTASAINDAGQIVGNTGTGAFLYSGGTMMDLTPLLPNGSQVVGINDAGQIAVNDGGDSFLYYNQVLTPLSVPGLVTNYATAINSMGQVVGYYDYGVATNSLSSPITTAFLYSNGDMADLGTLPAPYNSFCYALGINNAGQVVGYSQARVGLPAHAFLYSNGSMTDVLGVFGAAKSEATDINDSGQIVGYTNSGGFLYSNGVMTALDGLMPVESGVQTEFLPKAINDNGWIVGQGGDGQSDGFLLIPTPEPASVALLAVGAAGFLVHRRRDKIAA